MVYIAVAGLILIGIAFAVWKLLQRSQSNPSNTIQVETATNKSNEKPRNNAFNEMRNRALTFPSEQFEIEHQTATPIVYGVVMDWNLGEGTATFVSFMSGDASMYTSTGGGVIGGVGHENVRKASIQFMKKGQNFVSKAQRSDDLSLPNSNSVKFFLLTTQGRFVAEERLHNFDNGSSQWLDLFEEANKVITELRAISGDFEK